MTATSVIVALNGATTQRIEHTHYYNANISVHTINTTSIIMTLYAEVSHYWLTFG